MKKTNLALHDLKLKSCPWGTSRGKLEYEISLCDRGLLELESAIDNVEYELELLKEDLAANSKHYDDLKAQLSELAD